VWGGVIGTEYIGLIWTWVEMLEFLSEAWPYLAYEQGYPLGLQPISPTRLNEAAELRWMTRPAEFAEQEQDELLAFQETHDLSRGVQGLFVPSVTLVRSGNLFQIGAKQLVAERPVMETLRSIQDFGDHVAKRLSGIQDERAWQVLKSWNCRLSHDKSIIASIATGRSKAVLDEIFAGTTANEVAWVNDDFVLTESLALVGLTRGILEVSTLTALIARVKAEGKYRTTELDTLSERSAQVLLTMADAKPYDQGYALAGWLRAELGVGQTDRVDPDKILASWGVKLKFEDLGSQILDAIACWGPMHGPVVWLNKNEKHLANEGARRATAAHEICHLLVDRLGALPLAEVVDGNIPRAVEQRANAFAAELLLPRSVAANAAREAAKADELLRLLAGEYGVSRELAARQVDNSNQLLSSSLREELLPFTIDRRLRP
jgi:hypothetical protein